ncbi:MAG: tetratricopeptide repeat protein [Promethearchaeota archaeon]|nr:MAG: tetratricopeptide repeat protein [Candidatus Lokiarchaeota archaeon]
MKNPTADAKKNYLKAQAFFENDKIDQALELVNKHIKKTPDDLNFYHLRARIYIEKKNLKGAIQDLLKILEHLPKNKEVLLDLAFSYAITFDYEKALEIYDTIIDLKSNHLRALYSKALVLNDMKRHIEALEAINDAFDLYPLDVDVVRLKGLILYNLDKFEPSWECFDKVLHFKPDDSVSKQYKQILKDLLNK